MKISRDSVLRVAPAILIALLSLIVNNFIEAITFLLVGFIIIITRLIDIKKREYRTTGIITIIFIICASIYTIFRMQKLS